MPTRPQLAARPGDGVPVPGAPAASGSSRMIMDTNKCIACQTLHDRLQDAPGPGARARSTCSGTTSRRSRTASTRLAGTSTSSTCSAEQAWNGDALRRARRSSRRRRRASASSAGRPTRTDSHYPNIGEDDAPGQVEHGAVHRTLPHHDVDVLPAAHLQPLHLPGLRGRLPARGDLQAAGGRHRARRPGALPRLPGVPHGVPVQEDDVQPETGTSRRSASAAIPKIEQGLQTQCSSTASGKLRLTGFLSPPGRGRRPDNPADYLVHVKKVALPLYPQLGLEPNVYYIPPVHVPRRSPEQMFGPGAAAAIKTYRNAKDDPELLGLLCSSARPSGHRTVETAGRDRVGPRREGRGDRAVPLREPVLRQARRRSEATRSCARTAREPGEDAMRLRYRTLVLAAIVSSAASFACSTAPAPVSEVVATRVAALPAEPR